MLTRTFFAFVVLCSFVVAQESEPVPSQFPGMPQMPAMSPMRAMNPVALLRMRDQTTLQLQHIQRQLGFIAPNDTELQKTLTDMQAELLSQLKDINAQLKEQGVPLTDEMPTGPMPSDRPPFPPPAISPGADPTLIPGGSPQAPQRSQLQFGDVTDPTATVPRNPLPQGMMGGIVPGMTGYPGMSPNTLPGVPATPPRMPTEFDQDQAWADSPWAPKPSKELSELKQTVDGLRRELGEMRETVKALETQIQLLNRNILLMNPPTAR